MSTQRMLTRAVVALLVLGAPPAQGQETIRLRYRFPDAEPIRTRVTTETESTQTVQGMTQTMRQTTSMDFSMAVTGRTPEGDVHVRHLYEAVRVTSESPMGNFTYDSADPPASLPPALQAYGAMVGASFDMTVSPEGRVTAFTGLDAMMDRMLTGMELPPGPAGDMVRKSLEDQFGDDAMAEFMKSVLTPFPDRPLTVGDTWTQVSHASFGIPLTHETSFTLRSVENGVALFETVGTFRTDSTSVQTMGTMIQRFTLVGYAAGTLEVNVSDGQLVRGRTEGNMEGSVAITGPMGEMKIPMKTRTVTTTETIPPGEGAPGGS